MIILGNRIRSLQRHLIVPLGTPVIVGIPLALVASELLEKIGFPNDPQINSAILPAALFGRISIFNAEGKSIPDRTKPKETNYRTIWRTWTDWHGNYHSGYADIPYEGYPRIKIPAPGVEIKISLTTNEEKIITADVVTYEEQNSASLLHQINLFLAIFGECHIFTEDLQKIIQAPVVRLNWRILPKGKKPFAQVLETVTPILNRAAQNKVEIITKRIEVINSYGPDFLAIGEGGFTGYLIFGFTVKSLFLMESIFFGNATYGLGENWVTISRLTKAEILNQGLHTHRIVHSEKWDGQIHQIFQ